MENYKAKKISLGGSDIAALTMTGFGDEGVYATMLKFNGNGEYFAYVVNEATLIPADYVLEATFTHRLTIFDDERLVYSVRADKIEVYRTGEYGILIRVCNEDPIRILRRETVIYDHR